MLEVFLKGLERLKKEHEDIELMPFAVYSAPKEGRMLKKYGVRSFQFDNEYVGRKKNAGLRELMKLDWDYMLELGSDDLVHPGLLWMYRPYFQQGVNCFGINSCWFVDVETKRVALWKHDYAIGAGRCIKRSVFDGFGERWRVRYKHSTVMDNEKYGKGKEVVYIRPVAEKLVDGGLCEFVKDESDPFLLWTDTKNIALDGDSEHRLGMNGFSVKVIDSPPLVLDIKSGENIHSFDTFERLGCVVDKDVKELEREYGWKLAHLTGK